jgi:ribonuclease P protein component
MLSAHYRIRKSFFPQVTKGAHFSGEIFKIIVSKPISDHSVCTAIVAKKYYKSAVQRNYIRRVLYTIIKNQLSLLPKKTYVIMVTKKIPAEIKDKKQLFNKKEIKHYLEKDMQYIINLIHKNYE